ncbi:hypothetical protein [Virgibacillus alimentarius]|uniref:ATPase n=1 Tax=Virgibacillus alimentarius TaxID=698769 RepID=A0ABS4S5J7_9BACI|nr:MULTISPECIES: hypothetical protein [Virgibacillus]MBP2256773.1 hypothetical protein [Virgibacillus alimentarius]HLR65642.1 hypothetical protein [Virgibacillus sp.]
MSNEKYYVTGNTAEGFVNFLPTNVRNFNHVFILKHPSNKLKTAIIKEVIRRLDSNYKLEILCSALSDNYLDGVIIRKKSIAFIIDNIASSELSGAIEIDLELFLNHSVKPDVSDYLSSYQEYTHKAYNNFKTGLTIHDDLENIYIREMDFKKADKAADQFIQHLLQHVSKQTRTSNTCHRLFGTNTADGIVNIVSELIQPLKRRYYLKGRAGTGKSHFMKKVMRACRSYGFDIELYHCSFDPNSIDMVLIRELDFCIFDSTDPHEFMPERKEDEIIDLYEETVTPGTDEKYEEEIQHITLNYKSYLKKGMSNLKKAGEYVEKMEVQFEFTNHDVHSITTFILNQVK